MTKGIYLATVVIALFSTSLVAQTNVAEQFQLVSVTKIWDRGEHNAFTDLIRFDDKWFCTFRESKAHVGGNGKIRVLTSKDGKQWESAALLGEEGIDLRDPKLSITPDKRLMLVLGGSVYEGKTLKERQSRVAFSKDGHEWSSPQRVLEKSDWLWRVTWHQGHCYGISYANAHVKLVVSDDGVHFKTISVLQIPDAPNEATIRFKPDGEAIALVRRETGDKEAWIGVSKAPYSEWKWHSAGMQVGGPNFLVFPNNRLLASGRKYGNTNKEARTFVGRMNLESVTADLILPSGGDCSYPGMVWYDGLLWLSYYSTHEGKTCIYLAKIRLPEHFK